MRHWVHRGPTKVDEIPCAFRPSLPVCAQSLSTKCSTPGALFCVHVDAYFDENPCAIPRFVHLALARKSGRLGCTAVASCAYFLAAGRVSPRPVQVQKM